MKGATMQSKSVKKRKKSLGDFYWAYADILRGIGIPPSTYDQRILAFMAVKLLVDNGKLLFNFEYKYQFGLSDTDYLKYKGEDTKSTLLNIFDDLASLGSDSLLYFEQEAQYNPGTETNVLHYINHKRVFPLTDYIEELPNNYLEMVLDIYTEKADFTDYPKEKYKDLYEKTVARMKKLSGDLTGQHFTQKSIIHLMCEYAIKEIKSNDNIAIYDPTCGTGSMIMESAYYFRNKVKNATVEVYGQEYSGQLWMLCKIFLEICDFNTDGSGINNIIAYGNTLTEPAFAHGINGSDSFDFIIANPPFGVDWKQDYEEIVKNMASPKPNFLTIWSKSKPVTPKKSDGQFLFMMHILQLMQMEKARGKRALAAVISSSTLISTGSDTGSEAKIRRNIFDTGLLKAVIEQPHGMFTNTDISSHIWFYDSDHEESEPIKIIKSHNEQEPLFIAHPAPMDKMKHAYSMANIKTMIKYMNHKKEHRYITKNIEGSERCSISMNSEIERKIDESRQDLATIEAEIREHLQILIDSMTDVYER
jgi:type I restriction enzyme M protein